MEYKIKKMQSGGGFATFTPIIRSAPAVAPSGASNNASTEEKQQSSILDDKMLAELYKGNGLVNDVNQLVSQLVKIEKSSNLPFGQASNRTSVLQIAGKINELNRNKSYWEDAINRSKEAGGLGEVAVDSYGQVYTKGKDNKIQSLSISEYSKNRDKTKLLSVQELMYERQYNASLTGQNSVFTVADNAIGLNKITDRITGLIKDLGKESTESTQTYSKTQANDLVKNFGGKVPSQEEFAALAILKQVISSPSEYSKVEIKSDSEKGQINKALKYIWSTLGTPAQQKLIATAAINGVSDPTQFILDMLQTNTDESKSTTIIPIKTSDADGSGSGGEVKQISKNPAELFHTDRLYRPGNPYTINNPNLGISLDMTATGIGPLYALGKEGEVIGPGVVSKILTSDKYGSILDQNKIFIGDSKIDPLTLGELAYSGDEVAKVYVPVKNDGSPDLASLEKFKEVYDSFKKNKTLTDGQATALFAKEGFRGVTIKSSRDEQGNRVQEIVENNAVKPFLALPVLTNSASELVNNPWMVKMVGNDADRAETIMDQAFTIFGGIPSKPTSKNLAPSGWFSLETPYKSTLFLAYRPEATAIISSMSGHLMGQSAKESDVILNLRNSNSTSGIANISGKSDVLQ